ncbi:MAG: TolC family protein [Chitinophagales bacterium]|nr:TolC family protein [Chitinophagales bacterium]
MRKLIQHIIAVLLMLPSASLIAQDTTHLSLQIIFQRIESSYPEILMYDSKIKSIQAQAEGAKSWMPPTASFGLDRFPYDFNMLDSKDDPMNQAGLMFSVEQMIPNSGKLNAKRNYISSLASVQQNDAEWTKNILRSNAKLLYYQRYVAEKKIKTVNESVQLLNLFIATANERYKYNQSDLSTIYKAQAKTADLKNMQLMLQSQIAESNIGLNILMNRAINTSFSIDTGIALNNYETLLFDDTSALKRSDILSIESFITSMALNQNYMSSFKRPDFGLKAQHMQMFGMPNQFSVMGMMTIPIAPWSSKMYKSEVKSMGFEILAMQKEKETMQLMAEKMISEKITMLRYEKEQLRNYESEIIPSYQKNLETSLLAYKQNTGSFFILLDAWDMTLMKQMEYLDKLNSVLKLQAEYEFETERK